MQKKGKIIKWDDNKGFGFIELSSGSEEYFFHISSFLNKGCRPELDLEVNFIESTDKKGRKQAVRVIIENSSIPMKAVWKSFISVLVFLSAVAVMVFIGYLPLLVLYTYLIISIITFMVYAWDKLSAKKSRRRISEATLHQLSLLGGWPGALLGQQVFRHKSIKRPFRLYFWITVILNVLFLLYLLSPYGNWILQMR
jgi:uncharacterized membrane protein YsdA (DUF1294 family)/cold shock CspA family protein